MKTHKINKWDITCMICHLQPKLPNHVKCSKTKNKSITINSRKNSSTYIPHSANHNVYCQNADQGISLHKNFFYSIHISIHLHLHGFCVVPDLCKGHCLSEAYTFLTFGIVLSPQRALDTAPITR